MPADLTINDNAAAVVNRINTAINVQNKGVTPLGTDPNAGTVISRVNSAIAAENNDQLETVADNDNAADFINKVNNLYKSVLAGGSEPAGDIKWENVKLIACGDSITDPTIAPFGLNKYCYKAAAALGIPAGNVTDIGISGSTMIYSEGYSVTAGNAPQMRSFLYELAEGNETAVMPENAGNNAQYVGNGYKGPTGIDWGVYDVITLMLGTNDAAYCKLSYGGFKRGTVSGTTYSDLTEFPTDKRNYFSYAYEEAILRILSEKKESALLVLCVPPKTATGSNFDVAYATQKGDPSIKAIIEALAVKYHLPVVNFYDDIENMTWTDGAVHPDADGNAAMGELLATRLREEAPEDWGSQAQPGEYGDAPSILVLGNSYTQDSWAYVPYLLKEYGINIKVGIYYRNAGGIFSTKNEYYGGAASNVAKGFYYFDTAKQTGWELRDSSPTPQKSVKYYDGMENDAEIDEDKAGMLWDIIVLQQVSTGSYNHNDYGFSSGTIATIKGYIESDMQRDDFSFGWNINHPNGGYSNNLPTDILENIQEACREYGISIIFPYGTGIMNGRNYAALADVGFGGNGNMTYDGAHLAGGLPHYLASLTIIEALFRMYYPNSGLTVLGNGTIPDEDWIAGKNMPGGRGKSIASGTNEENCAIARKAAINACVNPWEVYGDEETIYESWPLTVVIQTKNSNIVNNGGYTVIDGGTSPGIKTSYILVPRNTRLSGFVIRAADGHTISGNAHSWRYKKYSQAEFVGNTELDSAHGTLPLSSGNTECNIGDYDGGNGLPVDHNILITVYGTT